MANRPVLQVVPPQRAHVGENFTIRRTLPSHTLEQADPFLMLDHFGPFYQEPNKPGGVGPHPHRGFETVTYLLEGYVGHRDSTGAEAVIGPGELQWMTAGAGIVHAERPPQHFVQSGGTVHGVQLWVNLAAAHKNVPPRHQELAKQNVPMLQPAAGVTVRVLAGRYAGKQSPIELLTDVTILHVTVHPGAQVAIDLAYPTLVAQVLQGAGLFGEAGTPAAAGHLVQWGHEAGTALLAAAPQAAEPLEALVLAGQPLNEPVVSYGPFVMNTPQQIYQAIDDYNAGRMGVLME
jgi:redox-sensitive bicupin YhaK (pirin superfamily)